MFKEEARWFSQQLAGIESARIFPMCNIGSSSATYRTQVQPWIESEIFGPAQARGPVVHVDIKRAPGVDIVGDFSDPDFRDRLREMRFQSVFCSNLLEHIVNPNSLCEIISSILPEQGLLFASCPHRYPYHPDPIDTLFRPSTTELAAMFPGMSLVESQLIDCGRYLGGYGELRRFMLVVGRCLAPFYRPKNWLQNGGYLPWLYRQVSAACVVLQKESAANTNSKLAA